MTINIWHSIIAKSALARAFDKVQSGGGAAGGDGITGEAFARNLNKNLQALSDRLRRGEHEFGECRQLLLQFSVFETRMVEKEARKIARQIEPWLDDGDSLRVYVIGGNGERRTQVYGDGPPLENREKYWLV